MFVSLKDVASLAALALLMTTLVTWADILRNIS
jgi:hypothetical protein